MINWKTVQPSVIKVSGPFFCFQRLSSASTEDWAHFLQWASNLPLSYQAQTRHYSCCNPFDEASSVTRDKRQQLSNNNNNNNNTHTHTNASVVIFLSLHLQARVWTLAIMFSGSPSSGSHSTGTLLMRAARGRNTELSRVGMLTNGRCHFCSRTHARTHARTHTQLRATFEKGPKFREPRTVSWQKNYEIIKNAVHHCQEKGYPPSGSTGSTSRMGHNCSLQSPHEDWFTLPQR